MNALHQHLPGVLLALSAMMLALMSPGPNILAVIGTSMHAGRRHGAALALGVATGTFVWATFAVLGLSALLTTYASAAGVIRVVGGAYLIYLGYRSLRSAAGASGPRISDGARREPLTACFRRGLFVQMSNPKAALAMTAIVTLGVDGEAPAWVGMMLVLGITLLSVIGHLTYVIAFSTRTVVTAYLRARRLIDVGFGAFFCLAGARLILGRD